MPAKYFCDGCGTEVTKANNGHRVTVKLGAIWVQTIPAINGTWNHGVVCMGCVRKTVNEGAVEDEFGTVVKS